jgi:hypothetical protein
MLSFQQDEHSSEPALGRQPWRVLFIWSFILILYFVDAPCGGAKTYAAIRHAHRVARLGKKVLIVQPSIILIKETMNDLAGLQPEVRHRAIHGETTDRVIAEVIDHVKHTAHDGEILFITHSAFMRLPYFHRRHAWHVIMDEIPQADWCVEFNIPHTHRLITDLFSVQPAADHLADNRYVRALASDRHALEAIAQNKDRDQVWDIIQQFAAVLLSSHWSAYVLDDQYTNLIASEGEQRKLLAFSHLKPSLFDGFASATILGACFRQSVLYHLWLGMGVRFRPHRAIQKGLRYTTHQNGSLLTIRYATEEDWSKSYRDKPMTLGDATTIFDRVVQRVGEVFGASDFVWMGNKDTPDDTFDGRGHRLPNSPYGLNPYAHIHNAVILSALLPPPAHFAFLDALGFDSREVKQAGYWQAVYQAAMRISLRNPDDNSPKTVIVMDRATAEWMATMFPGCRVARLDGIGDMPSKGKAGRHRQHVDDADRKRAHRDRFKLELHAALDLINGRDHVLSRFPDLANTLRAQMSELRVAHNPASPVDLKGIGGTMYLSIFHAEPLDFFPLNDVEAFIDGLRFFHSSSWPRKDANGLVSPSIFDQALADDTKRGLANIRAIWGVWFDNDGGDLSAEDFARLFPRLRMTIFNSYSSTPGNPRWRVFIPTTVAMPIAAHKAVTGQIMATVNKAGFWSKKQLETNARIKSRNLHGFDMSKLTPSSLFYLPCQAPNPAHSFFMDFASTDRKPLDPYEWAGYRAKHIHPEPITVIPTITEPVVPTMPETACPKLRRARELLRAEQIAKLHDRRLERQRFAIDKWHTTPANGGDAGFFQLGVDLRHAGLTMPDIEAILWQEAGQARHPSERRSQIRSIMRTLSQRNDRAAA